ncbi:shikimate kinase [[Clostridium] colinum]|uniref:shikimate kinase n=1 Tax=[Clostridium] colinum TaxID=36835 RepID=UPI0020258DD7|nr:shikimate kinase [[Clostridium] colinum]
MNSKNIVLIGFMGCGKTTIGKELAKNFNFSFIDTDCIIQQQENKSIQDIFEIFGEEYFRNIEKQVYNKVSKMKNCVISTGGGVIKDIENIINLKNNGIIVYLKASPEKIYENIKDDDKRPLLKNKNKFNTICDLLYKREPLYNKYADIVFDINDKSPFILAKNIKNTILNR